MSTTEIEKQNGLEKCTNYIKLAVRQKVKFSTVLDNSEPKTGQRIGICSVLALTRKPKARPENFYSGQ